MHGTNISTPWHQNTCKYNKQHAVCYPSQLRYMQFEMGTATISVWHTDHKFFIQINWWTFAAEILHEEKIANNFLSTKGILYLWNIWIIDKWGDPWFHQDHYEKRDNIVILFCKHYISFQTLINSLAILFLHLGWNFIKTSFCSKSSTRGICLH